MASARPKEILQGTTVRLVLGDRTYHRPKEKILASNCLVNFAIGWRCLVRMFPSQTTTAAGQMNEFYLLFLDCRSPSGLSYTLSRYLDFNHKDPRPALCDTKASNGLSLVLSFSHFCFPSSLSQGLRVGNVMPIEWPDLILLLSIGMFSTLLLGCPRRAERSKKVICPW